jgi:hypothetical protein
MKKNTLMLLITLPLMLCLSVVALAKDAHYQAESSYVIREILISPLDDNPFVAEFHHDLGKILFFEMDGRPAGYRLNQNEDDFWTMVAANLETRQLVSRFMDGEIIRRNSRVYDHQAFTITEYDAYGNRTVHYLTEEDFSDLRAWRDARYSSYMSIESSNYSDIQPQSMWGSPRSLWGGMTFAPNTSTPRLGNLVSNGFHRNIWGNPYYINIAFLDLEVRSGLGATNHAHAFFSNRQGDEMSYTFGIVNGTRAWHRLTRAQRDYFGVRISSTSWLISPPSIQGDTVLTFLSYTF